MFAIVPIADMPSELRNAIARLSELQCQRVEILKGQYFDAERSGNSQTASEIYARLAENLYPRNPTIHIVGGEGGYVAINRTQTSLDAV